MKIAIDIDEVIVEFVEKYMRFVEKKGFKSIKYEDVFSYELWDVLEIEKELCIKLMDEYNSSSYFRDKSFVNNSKEGVKFLNKNYEIYFITARPKNIHKETRDLIFEEFGILGNKVMFSGYHFREGKEKDEICNDLNIGLIIEDSGRDSLRYAENGLKVLLLDKPWNRGFKHENIYRCFSWDDILDKVKEINDE